MRPSQEPIPPGEALEISFGLVREDNPVFAPQTAGAGLPELLRQIASQQREGQLLRKCLRATQERLLAEELRRETRRLNALSSQNEALRGLRGKSAENLGGDPSLQTPRKAELRSSVKFDTRKPSLPGKENFISERKQAGCGKDRRMTSSLRQEETQRSSLQRSASLWPMSSAKSEVPLRSCGLELLALVISEEMEGLSITRFEEVQPF